MKSKGQLKNNVELVFMKHIAEGYPDKEQCGHYGMTAKFCKVQQKIEYIGT